MIRNVFQEAYNVIFFQKYAVRRSVQYFKVRILLCKSKKNISQSFLVNMNKNLKSLIINIYIYIWKSANGGGIVRPYLGEVSVLVCVL